MTLTVKLLPDHDCEMPYAEDEAVHIVVLHRNYTDPSEGSCGSTGPEVEAWIKANPDWFTVPLWMYEHGARVLAVGETNPFSCHWDSGRVGIVALRRDDWHLTDPTDAKFLASAESIATEYTDWAEGNCYGYVITDEEGEEVDSLWGLIGHDYAEKCAAKALADASEAA